MTHRARARSATIGAAPIPCALISYSDARGHRLWLTRDSSGNLTRISTGWCRNVYLNHDGVQRITRARTGIGSSMTTVDHAYDAPGRLAVCAFAWTASSTA